MDNLFLILFFFSTLAIIVFVILSLVQFIKKDKPKGMKQLKFAGASIIVFIISLVGFGMTTETETSSTDVEEVEAKEEPKEEPEETAEEKAAREAKEAEEKALAEQKAKEEAEAKAKAEEEERIKAEQEAANRKQLAVTNNSAITFPMLNKSADRYAGEPYYLKGEVVQAMEDGNYTVMRINMTQESWGWSDTVWVEYPNITDAVEGSIVEVYGEIYGNHTYDTAIGGSMTIPAILAEEVIVLQ